MVKKKAIKKVRKNLATDEKMAVQSALREINELKQVLDNKINALNRYYAPILGNKDENNKV